MTALHWAVVSSKVGARGQPKGRQDGLSGEPSGTAPKPMQARSNLLRAVAALRRLSDTAWSRSLTPRAAQPSLDMLALLLDSGGLAVLEERSQARAGWAGPTQCSRHRGGCSSSTHRTR
jgi:hypothetical protein